MIGYDLKRKRVQVAFFGRLGVNDRRLVLPSNFLNKAEPPHPEAQCPL